MYLCWLCGNQGVWRVRTAQRGERKPSGVLNTDWLWLPRTVEMCEAHVWRCSSGTRWSTTGTQKNSSTGSGSSFTILLCYQRKYLPLACSLSICFSLREMEPPWDKVTYVEFLTHCSSGEESPFLSLPLAMLSFWDLAVVGLAPFPSGAPGTMYYYVHAVQCLRTSSCIHPGLVLLLNERGSKSSPRALSSFYFMIPCSLFHY